MCYNLFSEVRKLVSVKTFEFDNNNNDSNNNDDDFISVVLFYVRHAQLC